MFEAWISAIQTRLGNSVVTTGNSSLRSFMLNVDGTNNTSPPYDDDNAAVLHRLPQ